MNDVDDGLWLIVALIIIILALSSAVVFAHLLDVISQVPVLDEFFEVGFEGPVVFGPVPILLVVGPIALNLGGRVTLHQLWQLKKGWDLILLRSI